MLFMIGDRMIDMQTGLNAKAKNILIYNYKTVESGDIERAKKFGEKIHITNNFLGAATFIVSAYKVNNKKI